jgi:hypothetical protein
MRPQRVVEKATATPSISININMECGPYILGRVGLWLLLNKPKF